MFDRQSPNSCSVTSRVQSLPGKLAGPAPNRLPEGLLLLCSIHGIPSAVKNGVICVKTNSTAGENAVVLAQYSAEAWLGRAHLNDETLYGKFEETL
ncbi:MAG: hypothetical protein QOH35_2302 [Acidobacteriaceae bacterium]|nr:hypothetical protein [Acidobacteriaceae bacterium]